MDSRTTLRAIVVALAAGCGAVESMPPDAAARAVACNGGPVDVLDNGGFDAASGPWQLEPPTVLCGPPRITPDSGSASACFGGFDGTTHLASRDVPLPAGAASARLTGRICITTAESGPVDADVLAFDLVDGVAPIGALGQRTNRQGASTCAFTTFTLETQLTSDPVTATLRIRSTLDPDRPTSFFVDTLALAVACR